MLSCTSRGNLLSAATGFSLDIVCGCNGNAQSSFSARAANFYHVFVKWMQQDTNTTAHVVVAELNKIQDISIQ